MRCSMRCSISSRDETPSWKYNSQQSIFDKLWGVSSGDETLCSMLVITNKQKHLEGEIKDARMSSFSSDHQTLVKH